jgi:hypothetical protein
LETSNTESLDNALLEKIEEFFPEDDKKPLDSEVESNEIKEPPQDIESIDNTKLDKDSDSSSEEQEEQSESEESESLAGEQENIEDEKLDESLDKALTGFSHEFKEVVGSIEDESLRNRMINASKIQRADLDRKRQELGESGKLAKIMDEAIKTNGLSYNKDGYANLVQNYLGFDALFVKDPTTAIKNLAESANIKLEALFNKEKTVEDVDIDEYRTPEEILKDKELENLKERLNLIERQSIRQNEVSAEQKVQEFANTREADGNLKYPYFDRVRKNMGLFFNDDNPDMTMEKAYEKALLLDDELISKRDSEILRKAEEKRKREVEKAKSLKKQSMKSSKISTRSNDPHANLERIVSTFYN